MVMEKYTYASGREPVNGFVDDGHLSRVWAGEWIRRTEKPPLYLTKLHGSVNWHEGADGKIEESGGVTQRNNRRDIMIAPTEGAKDYSRKPFPRLMEYFEEEMKDINVLLVIGFSFRDKDVVDIIKERLANDMWLISVSPTADKDIPCVSDADINDVEVNSQTLKTVGDRIILIEKKFKLETIDDVRSSLRAAYKFIGSKDGHARQKGKNTML